MKVKVGDKVYGAGKQPIMVILTEQDKKNIANMAPEATKYCAFDESIQPELIEKWMKEV